jgi:hypothetical protein
MPTVEQHLDAPDQLRLKAEACRRLADITEDAQRKALWIERGDYWEQVAAKAAKQPRPPMSHGV